MFRTLMKSKLHRATVTGANLNYVGSITIDPDLIELADLMPNERVQIVNNNNGARLETYVIPGVPGSGDMCLNGAAARLVQPGDKIIVISYGMYDREEAAEHEPTVIILDEFNQPENIIGEEPAHSILSEL
ncbi:aspartate 1-decarboxylase [Euzebya tangerina]|uniref:aspartate 1-decarboxylase n=1 Tax=Euzebya tangerina TaxID=591198 RepID=UPI000E313581|nr:aspartate 1-decarboxylase [Euzebya tangerina]